MKTKAHFIKTLLICISLVAFLSACGGGSTPNLAADSFNITSGNRQITIGWTTASKVSGMTYNLYWSTSPGVTTRTGSKITAVTSPYIHTGLTNNTMYYYIVTSVEGNTESKASPEIAASPMAVIPPAPSGVTITPSNSSIQLKIDRTGAASTTKFNLYWAANPALTNANKIVNAFGTSTTFQHTSLNNGTTYYYAVSAEGPEGESPKSNILAATPLADSSAVNYVAGASQASIAVPNAVTVTGANQSVTLTWNIPTNRIPTIFDPSATPTQTPVVSAFTIYWSTSFINNLATATKISVPVTAKATTPITFTHNTGLTNNTPYYYIVTTVADKDANGNQLVTANGIPLTFESVASSQVAIVPEAKAPFAPADLSATSGNQQISLTWTKSSTSGAMYNIYMSTTQPVSSKDLVTPANLIAKTDKITYVHSGLPKGTMYYYTVTAFTDGESTPTAVVAIQL